MNPPTKICIADHADKLSSNYSNPDKTAAEMQRIADAITTATGGPRVRWVWDPADPDNVVGWYEKDPLDVEVVDLGLPVRVERTLIDNDIDTLDKLVETTEKSLMRHRNFGWKSLVAVKKCLAERGLSLAKTKRGGTL